MKHIYKLALLAAVLPFAAQAATLNPCIFGKYNGQVMPVPSSRYLHTQILVSTSAIVTQTIPTVVSASIVKGIVWGCYTGTTNYRLCFASANTDACGSSSPVSNTTNTDWEINPICHQLDLISGTTINDLPTVVKAQSDSYSMYIGASYCRQ